MLELISALLRTVIYLWVGTESLFLSHLYYYGYLKFKHTPIICMLQRFFLALGIFFTILAFMPILGLFLREDLIDLFSKGIVVLPAIPIGFFLSRFRAKSVEAS